MANKKFSQFTDVISLSPNIFIVGYDSVLNDNIRILSTDLPAIIGAVTGSGTAGKLSKWLTATSLEDSLISDDGIEVTIAGYINATAFVKVGGIASEFLKADGSVDSNAYITLTDLSASAPLSYDNLTGVFSIAEAGSTVDGYLSALDWNIFNQKQDALGGTGLVKSTAGTISYITDNSANWTTAYNNMIVSAAVTGTLTKTLTLNQQDGGTITASWTDDNTDAVTSVFGRTGAVIAQSGDYSTTLVTEGTNLYFTNARARAAFSSTAIGLTYDSITGILSTTAGYGIPTTASQSNWDTAYTNRITSATAPLNITANTISISQSGISTNGYLSSTDWNTFNNKQNSGNYITALTGEATATGPGSAAVTLSNSAVINKVLTGLNITGGSITSSDSILTAFGKVQNQINGLFGGVSYQGTWDAAINDPTLTSSVGVQGYYYVINVAGSTNLDGITDWNVGDWAIFDGSVWQQVDNTDSVVSVNGFVGIVSLTTTNIPEGTNLYYTDARSRSAFSETVTGLSYDSITGVLSTTSGYGIPTTASQTTWDTAYNERISALTTTGSSGAATLSSNTLNIPNYTLAGLGGVPTSRTLTINGVSYDLSANRTWSIDSMIYPSAGIAVSTGTAWGTSITDNSTNWNTAYTERISSATAPLSISSNVISISQSGAAANGYLSSTDWNTFSAKQNALSGTGLVKSTAGVISYITDNSSNWNTAYNDIIVSAAVTGTTTKTLTLTQQDSGTVTASWTDLGLTSVGLSMPSAFTVTNSPLTSNGTIAVTGAGVASQYVRGDGTLANFPTSGGGGGGVSYYLNGGTSQGTIGGNAYYQMSKSAVVGSNADFSINADGYIANFITDAGDPALLNIPAGNWNFEIFFSASSGGGSPRFYVELYKYNGATFTLIASNSANPEGITGGTAIDLYTTAVAIPATTLTLTDRLAIRIYVIHSGRTITLHTQGTHLCQVITTFSAGITALNGLTSQVQYFQAGTSGTDFNISSVTDVHTFNLPTASAINRGALSTTDWSAFNSKQNAITLTTSGTSGAATFIGTTLNIPQYQAAGTYINSVTASSPLFSSGGVNPNITIQQANISQGGYLTSTDWNTFNDKQPAGSYITALTGEATATGPGSVAITLTNNSVTAKVLTGLNITGGTVNATDSIVTAFGKVQNQLNGLVGGTIYKGVWNASTNNPFLASGVGTQGWYYIVNVAGSTNLDGITDWNIGDWAIFDGTAWQQVDNTDSVTSVNGFTGAVSLTTSNITEGTNLYYTATRFNSAFAAKTTTDLAEGTNLYFTDARARAAISLTTLGTSGAATYNSGILNIPQYQAALTDPVTGVGTTNYVAKWTSGTAVGNSSIYDNGSFVGIGGTTALGGRLNITFNSTTNDAIVLKDTRTTGGSGEWRLGPGSGVIGFGIYSNLLGYSPFTIANSGAATFVSSVTATSFVKSGGTSSEFLLADGSVTTLPTANWNTAYDNSIVSAAVTGTTTKTLTLNQQDGGTVTASWTDENTDAVSSVFGRTGAVIATAGDYSTTLVTEGTNLYFTDARARAAISVTATGLTYSGGVISLTAGYSIPTTASQTTWNTAYNDSIVSAAVTGTTTKTLTLNQQDGGTITASWTDINTDAVLSVFGRTGAVVAVSGDYTTAQVTESGNLYFTNARAQAAISLTTTGSSGAATYTGGVLNIPQYTDQFVGTVTSVGLSAPTGFSVSNSPITTSGTIALGFTAGYSLPTTASQATWTTAYNDSIVSAAVTGTTTKTLTLNQQDGGTITASWTDINSDAVTSVFGRTGAVVAVSGDYNTSQVTESGNLYFTDARARAAISGGTGISYNSTTGVITNTITQYTDALARASLSFTAGSGAYNSTTGVITIPTDNNQIANGAGYITSGALSGYLPLSGGTMSGTLNLQSVGTSGFTNGTGDGASFATYNFALSGWSSMAFYNPTVGGAYPNQVSGLIDFRSGTINMKGGFLVDGSTVLYAGNYNSYAPTLTGGGASGTWGINITGTAGSLTSMLISQFTNDSGYLTSASLSGYLPLTGGTLTGALNGTSADFSSSVTASSFITTFGSSTEFLKADGTIDSNTYVTSTGTGATGLWGINIAGSSDTTYNVIAYSLGTNSVNVNNTASAVFRNENGAGAVIAYAPVLHIAATDTMWQLQGTYGTTGNGTLYFRQGYNGSWGTWLTMISSANISSYLSGTYLPLTGGTLTGALSGTTASFSTSLNNGYALSLANTGTTGAGGLYVNIGTSATGAPIRVDKAGFSIFLMSSTGNVTMAGDLAVNGGDIIISNSSVGGTVFTRYQNTTGNVEWRFAASVFTLFDNVNEVSLMQINPTTVSSNFYYANFNINTSNTSGGSIAFKAALSSNTWTINKNDTIGLSITRDSNTLYNINNSGTHSFYSSTPTLLASITANGSTFGGTAGLYTKAYFHVTGVVGATNVMFGNTYPIALGGNFPGIYFNMYYNAGYKIASGTGVYGAANTYDPINGILGWLVADISGNEGASIAVATQLRLDRLGRVSIGTTASTSEKLYVGGTTFLGGNTRVNGTLGISGLLTTTGPVYASVASGYGTLTTTNPSDIRLKEEIETLKYGLKEVMALKPVTYKWKDRSNGGQRSTGLIAQDVQEIMPDYVKNISEDNSYLGLDSYAISIVLINAIKELQAEIEILKNK